MNKKSFDVYMFNRSGKIHIYDVPYILFFVIRIVADATLYVLQIHTLYYTYLPVLV